MSNTETFRQPGPEQQKEVPTSEQTAVADALFYCKFLDLMDNAARQYGLWKISKSHSGTRCNDQEESKSKAKTALEDLYEAGEDKDKIMSFKKAWGDETEEFQSILIRISPKIREENEKIHGQAYKFGVKAKLNAAVTTTRKMIHLSNNERLALLQQIGYTKEEAVDICKKIAISSGLSAAEAAVFFGGTFAAAGYAATHPFYSEMNNTAAYLVPASYALKYMTATINSYMNMPLLREKSIKTSPNVFSTSMYYLLNKFFKDDSKVRSLFSTAVTLIEPAVQDIFWTPTFAVPGIGASVNTARCAASTGINLLESGAKELFLRKIKSQKKICKQ